MSNYLEFRQDNKSICTRIMKYWWLFPLALIGYRALMPPIYLDVRRNGVVNYHNIHITNFLFCTRVNYFVSWKIKDSDPTYFKTKKLYVRHIKLISSELDMMEHKSYYGSIASVLVTQPPIC